MTRPRMAPSAFAPPRTVQAVWLTSVVVGAAAISLGAQHSSQSGVGPRDVSRLIGQATGRDAQEVTVTAAYGSAVDGHWQMIATIEWTATDGSPHDATVLMPATSEAAATSTLTALPAATPRVGESLATAARQLDSVSDSATPVAVFRLNGTTGTFIACAGEADIARCTSIDASGQTTHPVAALRLVGDLGADAVQMSLP